MVIRRSGGNNIKGTFSLANVLAGPSGTVSLSFEKLNFGAIGVDTLNALIRFEAAKTGTFNISAMATNGTRFDASGDLALSDSATAILVRDVGLRTDSSRWTLRGVSNIRLSSRGRGISIDSLVVANQAGGRVSVEATVPDSGKARMFVRGDSVSLYDVGRVLQSKATLNGWATFAAQGAGTNASPVINVQTTMHDVRYGGINVERVTGSAVYENARARIAMDLARGGRPALLARGSLPIELRYFGFRFLNEDSLQATIRSDSANFDIVEAIIPGLHNATGKLAANVDIGGSWSHPDLTGELRVENGEVTVDTLGVRLKGVNVDIGLFGHRDSLAIRRFVAWSGTGPSDSVSLRGYIAYHDLSDPYLNLQLDARTFRALDRRALARLDLSTESAGLRLRGNLRGASLTGALFVDRGIIYLPDPELAKKQSVDFASSLVDTSAAGKSTTDNSGSILSTISLDGVRITLGDEVWLRSKEANIKLGGSLNVQRSVSGGKPSPEGVLVAERGTYSLALGALVQREFQVEGGTITFLGNTAGSILESTDLNISALHTVRTEGGADLRIRVRLTGPVQPQSIVTLESAESFQLSQSDLVSYLIFGQPNFELGTDRKTYAQLAAQTLLPSAQAFAATELRGFLGSWADIVQVRPGFDPAAINNGRSFTEILMTSRLGLEKQVTNNLFVSVGTGVCQFGPQASQSQSQWSDIYNGLSGKFEFRLSPLSSIKAGKEPSAQSCERNAGRLVPTPTQWAFSLFKTWRF
jgi:translocation and assembly module TamB